MLNFITPFLIMLLSSLAYSTSPIEPDILNSSFKCEARLHQQSKNEKSKSKTKSFILKTKSGSDEPDVSIEISKLFKLPKNLIDGFISISAFNYSDETTEQRAYLYVRTPSIIADGRSSYSDSNQYVDGSINGETISASASLVTSENDTYLIVGLDVICTISIKN